MLLVQHLLFVVDQVSEKKIMGRCSQIYIIVYRIKQRRFQLPSLVRCHIELVELLYYEGDLCTYQPVGKERVGLLIQMQWQ